MSVLGLARAVVFELTKTFIKKEFWVTVIFPKIIVFLLILQKMLIKSN